MAVDQDKLNAFRGRAIGDIGAALSANMVLLGDKLGLIVEPLANNRWRKI